MLVQPLFYQFQIIYFIAIQNNKKDEIKSIIGICGLCSCIYLFILSSGYGIKKKHYTYQDGSDNGFKSQFTANVNDNEDECLAFIDEARFYVNSIRRPKINGAQTPKSVILAVSFLESGFGKSWKAQKHQNYFGIKKKSVNYGEIGYFTDPNDVNNDTDTFCSYRDFEHSAQVYCDFLAQRSIYANCFDCANNDFGCWANALQKAGYSTNEDYAKLLVWIINKFELHQLDDDEVVNKPKDDFVFFLNNSHGKTTIGKVTCYEKPLQNGENCIYEWILNRSITSILIKRFDAHGISYVNVVPETEDISLKERVKRINSYKDKVRKGFVLTIDHNAAPFDNSNEQSISNAYNWQDEDASEMSKESASGMESFKYGGNGFTDEFLTLLSKNVEKRLPNWTQRGIKDGSNFYTIKNTVFPATILELGFFDNYEEANFINSDYFKTNITEAIVETCCFFAKKQYVPLEGLSTNEDKPKSENKTESSTKPQAKNEKRKLYSM